MTDSDLTILCCTGLGLFVVVAVVVGGVFFRGGLNLLVGWLVGGFCRCFCFGLVVYLWVLFFVVFLFLFVCLGFFVLFCCCFFLGGGALKGQSISSLTSAISSSHSIMTPAQPGLILNP